MSHDMEAAWATMEVASLFKRNSPEMLGCPLADPRLSIIAGTDKRKIWPIADGIIRIEDFTNSREYSVALEYKRPNEGIHGVLTALGQAQAYLHKGFSASAIVIPAMYDSHSSPGDHLAQVIDLTARDNPIYLYTYQSPDVSSVSPFSGKLRSYRNLNLSTYQTPSGSRIDSRVETQWGHMREGSSDSHSFYEYLRAAKSSEGADNEVDYRSQIPEKLLDILERNQIPDPVRYLSFTTGDTYHERVWRKFWFSFVAFREMLLPWTAVDSTFEINDVRSRLRQPNGDFKAFFSGKSNSIKNKLVISLNQGETDLDTAWWEFARNIHSRAHSFREDIDSGLEALGLIDSEGRPTPVAYKFLDACDRSGTTEAGLPSLILSSLLLNNANYAAFLHYVFRVSEAALSSNPLRFTEIVGGIPNFNRVEYLNWLSEKMSDELLVMRKVSQRGGQQRMPFQAELAVLRRFGLVKGFRLGVGLEIDWPEVQKLVNYEV